MKRINRIFSAIFLAACFFCGVASVFSQGTNLGTIRGTVTDPNGAVVPGATVQVTDVETNLSREFTTNNEGSYEAPNLKPGTYKVTVTGQGFKTLEIRDVLVRGSNVSRADAQLQIGVAETVEITEGEAAISTDTPTVSNTIVNRQLLELPRDSRDIYQFLYLNPNITQSNGGEGSFKFLGAQSYGAAFTLDGQRANGGIFSEPTASQPSLETIGELTVLSNNFTAEYAGIANIRVVTKRGGKEYHGSLFYNNKNSALAARVLDEKIAEAEFTPDVNNPHFPTPYFNLNETGGSFSGPIPFSKEKTFFLTSYERRWDIVPTTFSSTTLPGPRLLLGDFSQLRNSSKPAVPAAVLGLLTPTELANNVINLADPGDEPDFRFIMIPQRLLNPTTQAIIQQYFPHVSLESPINNRNGRLIRFSQRLNGLVTRNLFTTRIDHTFSDKDSIYGVYNFSTAGGSHSAVGNPFPALGLRVADRTNNTLALSYTHSFSNNLINEARGGFNRQHLYTRANQTLGQFLSGVGFDESDLAAYEAVVGPGVLDLFSEPRIDFTGFATFPDATRNADRRQDQDLVTFGDTLNWITGRHTFKFGADVVKNHATDGFVQNRGSVRGRIRYTGGKNAASNLAKFELGLPADSVNFVDKRRGILDVTNTEYGFFGQDDFKIRPNLTLYLGLRYELITPFVDKNDLMVNFDPNFTDPQTGRRGRFVVPSADIIPLIDPGMVSYGVVVASDIGLGRGLVKADRNNFAPRLGFAWRITEKDVLRGGYGWFFPTAAAQGVRDALESAPFNQGRTKRRPTGGWPGGINGHGISPLTGGRLSPPPGPTANAIPFNLQQPRVEQFNITYEREVGWNTGVRFSYLGTRIHGTIGGIDLNMLPPSDVPFGTHGFDDDGNVVICDPLGETTGIGCEEMPADSARRPFPELGSFLADYGNLGDGRSHAFQVEVNRRFARGFSFDASYTLLDQKSSGLDVGESSLGGQIYNQFNPDLDFSRDSFVARHRFTAYFTYDLPFGRGRKYFSNASRAADMAFGGWTISSTMFAKSGSAFTPFWTCNNCDPVWPGNIASDFIEAVGDFSDSSFRARQIGDPRAGVSGDRIFNPDAFAPPSVGADVLQSGVARNTLTGPGTWALNLSIRKNFQFSERVNLSLGATFDNLFNHPLLSPVDLDSDFSRVGSFSVDVNQATGQLNPVIVTPDDLNPDFGLINKSFKQEGFDNRRSIRFLLRLTF